MELHLTLTKKQEAFIHATADEVLFGGAAGGGKSYGQIADALIYALRYEKSRQLILRRTFPELARSLITTSLELFPKGIADYNQARHIWRFTNGSLVEFGCCDTDADVTKYQSAEYDVIRIDELTHFTAYQYRYLMSRLRGATPYPRQMKCTCNPGGRGHGWVKERFISPSPPGEVFPGDGTMTRVFLPAFVQDNRFLMDADPGYIDRLSALPEAEKKALLLGDWDIFEGQVFTEWRNNPAGYRTCRYSHVITPFRIPLSWRRYRSFDFGYSRPFCVQWWATDHDGTAYLYRELYGCTDTPDTGVKWSPDRIAKEIRRLEADEPSVLGVADPSIYDKSRGESVAEMMERAGVFFEPGDNTRLAGAMQMHRRLAFDADGKAGLYVFSTCRGFIRTLPALCYDAAHTEDVDTTGEDHPYDAARYFLMYVKPYGGGTR